MYSWSHLYSNVHDDSISDKKSEKDKAIEEVGGFVEKKNTDETKRGLNWEKRELNWEKR